MAAKKSKGRSRIFAVLAGPGEVASKIGKRCESFSIVIHYIDYTQMVNKSSNIVCSFLKKEGL